MGNSQNAIVQNERSVDVPIGVLGDSLALVDRPAAAPRWLTIFLWCIAVLWGAIEAWASRQAMDPDGISYLDMGAAYLRGDWEMAINAYWSPLYSWLLGVVLLFLQPTIRWEFPTVHLANFVSYLFSLVAFHLFLRAIIRLNRARNAETQYNRDGGALPEWAWLVLGYSVFVWSSLNLVSIAVVTPDMCVTGVIYLASAIVLRLRASFGWPTFALLGLVLGIGYLTKAAMFPLAFAFIVAGVLSAGANWRGLQGGLVAMLVFAATAGPFVAVLSTSKGRVTFGDSARLNYGWYVNGATTFVHWQGGEPNTGSPEHPTRKISDSPPIYEFSGPVGGTYPAWYDPSYWYEGLTPRFDALATGKAMWLNTKMYFGLFIPPQSGLLVGFVALYSLGVSRGRRFISNSRRCVLLLPVVAGFLMYAAVHAEPRFLGGFVVVLWSVLLSMIRLPNSDATRRLLWVVAAASLTLTLPMALHYGQVVLDSAPLVLQRGDLSGSGEWQVAEALEQEGVVPGKKIAIILNSFGAYWATLAKVQIVAETQGGSAFWNLDDEARSAVMETLASTAAEAAVAEVGPTNPCPGWRRLGQTNLAVYWLK